MATREDKAKSRISDALRRYASVLESARQRSINESDTSAIVYDMLGDVFGYNKYEEVTGQFKVRGQYADFAVKVNGDIKFFVEVKAIGTNLRPDHLRQVTTYAVNEGVDWAVLTNGPVWQLYHVGFEKPINVELVFEADVLSGERARVVDLLYLISKEAAAKDEMRKYWADKLALSAPNIVRALFSDDVIDEMRREFRQLTGYRLSAEEIRGLLLSEVVRPEVAEVAGSAGAAAKPVTRRSRPRKTMHAETQS